MTGNPLSDLSSAATATAPGSSTSTRKVATKPTKKPMRVSKSTVRGLIAGMIVIFILVNGALVWVWFHMKAVTATVETTSTNDSP
jgi:hypothetical protein